MENKVVPKIVKSNLRGVLLSKVDGVPIMNLLNDYRFVTNEDLDYKGMGFTHLIEFLNAVPDVARIINCPDKTKKVVGIALNNLNITANKSCFKSQNDTTCDLRNVVNLKKSNKPQCHTDNREPTHKRTYPTDPTQPYDFRAAFLKDRPDYQVLKFDPNCNLNTDQYDKHQQHSLSQFDHQLMPRQQIQQPMQHIQQPMQQIQQPMQQIQQPMQQPRQQIQQQLQPAQCKTTNNVFQGPVLQSASQELLNIIRTTDRDADSNWFGKDSRPSQCREDGPHPANVPRTMMLCRLQQVINEVAPGNALPRRCNFPSQVDIMLTHVEPQHKNFFWGIIISPYDSTIDEVLNMDVHKNKFQIFEGGKRAVMFFHRYFCRVWVKSIQDDVASVFMVDFGNSEQVSARKLLAPPNNVWNCAPIAIPFKHDPNKNFNIESHINERHRCWLTRKEGCIFEVEDMSLV